FCLLLPDNPLHPSPLPTRRSSDLDRGVGPAEVDFSGSHGLSRLRGALPGLDLQLDAVIGEDPLFDTVIEGGVFSVRIPVQHEPDGGGAALIRHHRAVAAGGQRQRGGDGGAQDSAARDPRCSGHGFASLQEYLTTGEPVSTRREACQGIRRCSASWMRAKSRMPITDMMTSAPKRVAVSMFPLARRIT